MASAQQQIHRACVLQVCTDHCWIHDPSDAAGICAAFCCRRVCPLLHFGKMRGPCMSSLCSQGCSAQGRTQPGLNILLSCERAYNSPVWAAGYAWPRSSCCISPSQCSVGTQDKILPCPCQCPVQTLPRQCWRHGCDREIARRLSARQAVM